MNTMSGSLDDIDSSPIMYGFIVIWSDCTVFAIFVKFVSLSFVISGFCK